MNRFLCIALLALVLLGGCGGRIAGPRFWWDDRNQTRLPDDYRLPADVGAPMESGEERKITSSGSNLTDDNLRDYRTDLEQKEEQRKSDASLLNF